MRAAASQAELVLTLALVAESDRPVVSVRARSGVGPATMACYNGQLQWPATMAGGD